MTNAIMKPDANPFANYQSDRQKHFPGRRMKFNKGEYLVGKDGDTLPIGTQLVAVMSLLTLGYQYWVGNDLVDTRLGLYVNGFVKPPRPTLGDTDREAWPIGLNGRPKDHVHQGAALRRPPRSRGLHVHHRDGRRHRRDRQ